jgi:hypothetical protein
LIRLGIHASVEAWYFQLSLMTSAAVAAWKEQLAQTELPQPMIKELLQRGYVAKASFVKAFASAEKLDKFIESLLSTTKNLGELEDPWDCHPVAGVIRDLWETGVATPISEPESKIAAPSSTGQFSLFGFPISKLDASQLREMWAKFAKDFPSEALDGHSRPCRQVTQQVYNQKKDLDLRFIPWKFLLSEAQCDESKQLHEKKERSFVSWLAEASGHTDQIEGVVYRSPFAIQLLLCLLGVALALVDWCHLGAANALMRKFISLYIHTQRIPHELNMRGLTIAEAEAADVEVCRKLGELINEGFSLDDAIHECIDGSPLLNSVLMLRPKAPASQQDPKGHRVIPYDSKPFAKGRGKGKSKGTCHKFPIGKCAVKDCPYVHGCERCGEKGQLPPRGSPLRLFYRKVKMLT